MAYFNTCPECGANLDSGETCNCKRKSPRRLQPTTDIAKIFNYSISQKHDKVKE